MVVFTCNTCSAVLKRSKVDNHCYQCRGCESLSCVDCGKDFWGDDYQTHTKCISEEEKYGRKDAVIKMNKGEAKQDHWIEQVQAAIEKASSKPSLKRLLERIKQYPNIPRKKAKFENFVKNSLKCYDTSLIGASWDVLMTTKTQTQSENKKEAVQENLIDSSSLSNGQKKEDVNGDGQAYDETSESAAQKNKKERKEERRKKAQKKEKKDKTVEVPTENATSDISKKSKKRKRNELEDNEVEEESPVAEGDNKKKNKKKRKADESIANEDNDECNGNNVVEEEEEEAEPPKKRKKTKFDWEEVIKAVLEKKGELSLKKLKRKVLGEFAAQDAANYNEDNLSSKFDKKVKTINGVKVYKDRACLKP